MSEVGLVVDRRFEDHDTGAMHAERPARLRAIRSALEASRLASRCVRIPLRRAPDELLREVHSEGYIRALEDACAAGGGWLDADTVAGSESVEIARLAAGSLVALCEEVLAGRAARGFAAVRPPGHHAEVSAAMGFCLFNNVAIAAARLLREPGIERVLIVDWDVHHGNGTQHIFESDPRVFFFSVHQSPLYPGTGAAEETGVGRGKGTTLNCPLPRGAGDAEFLGTLSGALVDSQESFRPQFVLVSAGFDAHAADPLAQLRVTTPAFGAATRIVRAIADRHAGGKIVSVLEGGYDLDALAASVGAHLEALLDVDA
jgi:acetoin utilization deacetylase AcuC-like enzyme